MANEMKATFIVYSDKDHIPVKIEIKIPDELGQKLMKQAVTCISLGISTAGGLLIDKTPLIDFK